MRRIRDTRLGLRLAVSFGITVGLMCLTVAVCLVATGPSGRAFLKSILPDLIARPGRNRIWCAASTGQEPYRLAMLLREHYADQADRFDILATDVSTTVPARAEAARYSQLCYHPDAPTHLPTLVCR